EGNRYPGFGALDCGQLPVPEDLCHHAAPAQEPFPLAERQLPNRIRDPAVRYIVIGPPLLQATVVIGNPTGCAVVTSLVNRLAARVERGEGKSRRHPLLELDRSGMEAAMPEIAIEEHVPK